jgi:DNA helicase II / ATP-dependent DNA helicase PcrA
LEVICRAIAQNAAYSRYESKIWSNKESESIKEAYWNIFIPLATGVIELNEELIETFPRNRLSILSIHQAKGLEFPMVIVDVSSDFKANYSAQRFKRFPDPNKPGETYILEDEVRQFSPLKDFPVRPPIDRAFDDLVRQYFVAYSRAQKVLILIGLYNHHIPNVALGWCRDGTWAWQGNLPWLEI